jgi:hypothetical protein
MARTTYNWWRRNEKRKRLDKKSSLIDKIKHGDFEYSQYYDEAQEELQTIERIKEEQTERGKRLGLRGVTIDENIRKETDQYHRRYTRLMNDHNEEEDRLLNELKLSLKKEFGNHWEYLYKKWVDGKLGDLSIEELYYEYQKLSNGNNRRIKR